MAFELIVLYAQLSFLRQSELDQTIAGWKATLGKEKSRSLGRRGDLGMTTKSPAFAPSF